MSLTLTEKQYWKGRIAEWIAAKAEEAYEKAGTTSQEYKVALARAVEDRVGVTPLLQEGAVLQDRISAIQKEKAELSKRVDRAWSHAAVALGLEGHKASTHSAPYFARPLLEEELAPEVKKAMGIAEEVTELEKLQKGLEDAIMMATSSARMQEFVLKVMTKYGVEMDDIFCLTLNLG